MLHVCKHTFYPFSMIQSRESFLNRFKFWIQSNPWLFTSHWLGVHKDYSAWTWILHLSQMFWMLEEFNFMVMIISIQGLSNMTLLAMSPPEAGNVDQMAKMCTSTISRYYLWNTALLSKFSRYESYKNAYITYQAKMITAYDCNHAHTELRNFWTRILKLWMKLTDLICTNYKPKISNCNIFTSYYFLLSSELNRDYILGN